MDAHSFVARNFAHLYVVGGRQHSMDAVAKMQRNTMKRTNHVAKYSICHIFAYQCCRNDLGGIKYS